MDLYIQCTFFLPIYIDENAFSHSEKHGGEDIEVHNHYITYHHIPSHTITDTITDTMSQFDTDQTKFIKYSNNLNNFYYFRGGLTSDDIAKLDAQLEGVALHEGNTSGVVNKSYRDSRITWLPKNDDWMWLYNKVGMYAKRANDAMWDFDISFMNEQIQYTEYDESYQGKYDWHLDFGSGASSLRKLSVVIQISDPADYEGGDLQFYTSKSISTVCKDKGTVICFPSYFRHRVTPVTKGKRRSLVLWVSGRPFK